MSNIISPADEQDDPAPDTAGQGFGGPAIMVLALYAMWVAATYWLEGRSQAFLHPENTADLVIYAVIANYLVGILGGYLLLRHFMRRGMVSRQSAGFLPFARGMLMLVLGLSLGLALMLHRGLEAASLSGAVGAYGITLGASSAEILICWALIGNILPHLVPSLRPTPNLIVSVALSAVAFGLVYFAHSAPLNSFEQVARLTGFGLLTGIFYHASRSLYATILFHNFLATFGTLGSQSSTGEPVFATNWALVALNIALVCLGFLLSTRKGEGRSADG